jgi:glycosyltransferase involved in cell wall biosynthesis
VTGALRPYRFYKYLPEFGIEPWVITGSEQNGTLERVIQAPTPTRRPNKRTLLGATEKAMRLWAFPNDDAVMWPLSAVRTAEELLKSVRIRAIISTFPPVNTHMTAAILHRRHKLPWVADFRDPLGARPPATGLPSRVNWFLEKRYVKEAAALITVTDVLRDEWKARYPRHADKFHLLWNGYDPADDISALPIPPDRKRILAHAGTLYWGRDPGVVLKSLHRLLSTGRVKPGSVALRLIGEMDKEIARMHQQLFDGLRSFEAIEVTGIVARDVALNETRTADSLVLFDTIHRAAYAVPAKVYEYLRIGRPVLAMTDRGSPIDRLLSKSGIPYTIVSKDDTDEQVDRALLEFLRMPSDAHEPSAWFAENFDGRRQAATLANIVATAISRRP